MKTTHTFVLTLLLSVLSSALTALFVTSWPVSEERLRADFYATENAVHVSPHSLRKSIMKNALDVTLVDLRSQEEYEREHIVGAISIPAYSDPDTSAYGDVDRIVSSFRALDPSRDIVVYCYSTPCMTGRKIGALLADNGIYVKHLGIGWNEWRYHWDLWNHEHEWDSTDVLDFIATGKEPGTYASSEPKKDSCPIQGDLGC